MEDLMNVDEISKLVLGLKIKDALELLGDNDHVRIIRKVKAGQAITCEFRSNRINLQYNEENGLVERVWYG